MSLLNTINFNHHTYLERLFATLVELVRSDPSPSALAYPKTRGNAAGLHSQAQGMDHLIWKV